MACDGTRVLENCPKNGLKNLEENEKIFQFVSNPFLKFQLIIPFLIRNLPPSICPNSAEFLMIIINF